MPFSLAALSIITPVGLWALLTLAIPILIHLFNRSRGRLVRIGHIDLVRQAKSLKVTELKLAQWILLLLRLAIFTLAALILAGLARPGLDSLKSNTAYVAPAWIRAVDPARIDDLLKQKNRRTLLLQPGFAPLDKAGIDEIRQSPLNISRVNNIWPLLTERLSLEHHAGSVDVYATDFLKQFSSARTGLPNAVNWNIAHAETIAPTAMPAVRAVIAYDEERSDDAAYFKAALTSLRTHRIPALTWELVQKRKLTPQHLNADWLILLSENAPDTDLLAHINTATTVLTEATGEPNRTGSKTITLPFYPFSSFSLYGLVQVTDHSGSVLVAVDGSPVLQAYTSGPARILQFNGRFSPRWSSITQQAEFPELLLQLMLRGTQQSLSFPDARINPRRLQQASTEPGTDIPLPRRSLQSLLAILLTLLWIAERWLSERKDRDPG